MRNIPFLAVLVLFSILFYDAALADGTIDSLENSLRNSQGLQKVHTLNYLSGLYRTISPEKSLDYGKEALKLSRKIDNAEWTSISLKNTGIAYTYLSRYDEAEKYFKSSLETAEKHNLKNLLPPSYNSLGNYYYLTGNLDKAIYYYEQAYKIGKESGSNPELNSYLNNIGLIYHNRGSYEKALKYYFESLKISEQNKDVKGISRALTNIGAVYNDRADYPQALSYYEKALDAAEKTGDLHTRANLLNNMANIYSEQGSLKEALKFHFNSLHLKEKIDDKSGAALSLGDIGRIYATLGEYPAAEKYLKSSLEILRKIGNKEGEIVSLVQIGRAYKDMKRFGDALKSFNEAISLSKEFSVKLLLDAYKGKSDVYEETGNYRAAYKSYMNYADLKDSIFNENSSEQIAELQTKYESEKKDKEISILQREKKIRELELDSQTMLRNSLIAGIAVLLIIAFLIYNRYRIKKNTNRMLEEKIREIGKQQIELKALNENKNKLLSIISHDLRSPFQALLGYSEILNQQIDTLSKTEIALYSANLNYTSHQTLIFFENLLEWARLQMDKITSDPEPFALTAAVKKASDLLKHNAEKKSIHINIEIQEDDIVYADENMISSVVRNLLSNAIKYSEKGSTVTLKSVPDEDHIDVVVQDEGTGLTEE